MSTRSPTTAKSWREDWLDGIIFLMDGTVALSSLVLLSPLLVFVGLAVFVTSGSPIFFRQKRLGKNGEIFTLYKFRSMENSSWENSHKKVVHTQVTYPDGRRRNRHPFPGKDRRQTHFKMVPHHQLTVLGRFIRLTSIDELPQLWLVLTGKMSLVGPRPMTVYEMELISPSHRTRFTVKPGLTGLWQVSGRSQLNYQEMLILDAEYVKRRSFGLYLLILLKTPRALIFPG